MDSLRNRLNGELTDPINLNIMIYTFTYAFTSVSILIICNDLNEVTLEAVLQVITDSIVPTTVTLVLGSVIQNIVLANQNRSSKFALSLWTLLGAVIYLFIYSRFRQLEEWWFSAIILFVAVVIVILSMCAIAQVEKEKQRKEDGAHHAQLSG